MIVIFAVGFAFVRACLTGENARMQLGVNHIVGRLGLADEDPRGGIADISASQIRRNTTPQAIDLLRLTDASIGAGRADFGAGGKGL